MDCPQCGTALTTYTLQGHEALVCERCGYVGIDADHHGKRRPRESWHDALRRFYDESGVESDPHVPVRPERTGDSETEKRADASASSTDQPTPRPTPDGATALRAVDREDGEAGAAENESETEHEPEADTDGSAGDDGARPSAGES